jgi:hypothetical protein
VATRLAGGGARPAPRGGCGQPVSMAEPR